MKKLILFSLLLAAPFFSVSPALAQNVRFDAQFPSISTTTATPFLVANVPPNSPSLAVCFSPANNGPGLPCTNYATTYNSVGAACSNGAQDTPQPQPSDCQSTGDAQGNIGFWAPVGTYDYTITVKNITYGPYTVTLGGSLPSFGTGAKVVTTDLTSTVAGDCAGWLTGNKLGDLGSCLTGSPVSNTTIVQPSDGSGNATSFNVNVFNKIVYAADNFNWHQSPAGTLTASVPATIPLSPCPLGLSTLNHTLSIDTQGTPEIIQITTNGCPASSGSGTITFTPLNNHSAGYGIGSATHGMKEASEWAKLDFVSPTTSALGVVIVPPTGAWSMLGTFYLQANQQTIDLTGSVLACSVAPCIFVGDSASTHYAGNKIINPICQPLADFTTTVGTLGATCIEDNAQGTVFNNLTARNPPITFPTAGYSAFYSLLQLDDDEGAMIDGVFISAPTNFASSRYGRCDTTLCSVVIYAPAGHGFSVPTIRHMNFTGANLSNGILYEQANTINIESSVIQSPAQWAANIIGGNVNIAGDVKDWYGEASANSNPEKWGTAGIIFRGSGSGRIIGSIAQGFTPAYTASAPGATRDNYYIRFNSSTLGSSFWFIAGHCSHNGTGTCTVTWPKNGTAGTISVDILRYRNAANAPAPYTAILVGGSASAPGTVATALDPAIVCVFNTCTFVDDVTLNTTAATANLSPAYCPSLSRWPGGIVYSPAVDQVCSAAPFRLHIDEITNISDSPIVAASGDSVPSLIAEHLRGITAPFGGLQGGWVSSRNIDPSAGSLNAGADIRQNASPGGGTPDTKGMTIVHNPTSTGNSIRGYQWTAMDADPDRTISTAGGRVSSDANDCGWGIDVAGNAASTGFGINCGISISEYIGGDLKGTNWLARLTSALKTFKVSLQNFPTAAPTGAAGYGNLWFDSTDNRYDMKNNSNTKLFVGNLNQVQNCGTTATCANTVLTNPQIVIGQVTLAGGTATVTGLPAFTSTSTFRCVAQDNTSIVTSANAVPASTTSITVTGTGTDVIAYHCIGN